MDYLENTPIYKIRRILKRARDVCMQTFAGTDLTREPYAAPHFIYENQGLMRKEYKEGGLNAPSQTERRGSGRFPDIVPKAPGIAA